MSRIGKQHIAIPDGVTAHITDGLLTVKGPKGELTRRVHNDVRIAIHDHEVTVDIVNKEKKEGLSLWGTFASHIKNMVHGVTVGFTKQLEINGVGYRVGMQGRDLKIEAGFSHPVIFKLSAGIEAQTEKNVITLTSSDKELLGDTAARIRAVRKPEPYKGKGIKYIDEVIRRKAGKTAAKGE